MYLAASKHAERGQPSSLQGTRIAATKKGGFLYLLDFPGDSERLYPPAIFVWSAVIALCTEGERSVLVGIVEVGMRYRNCVRLMSLGVQLCVRGRYFIQFFIFTTSR